VKAENVQFLEANKHHYETLVRAQFVQHLDNATREGMLRVIREEFAPGYQASLWCAPCIMEMIRYLYTQYEKVKDNGSI